MLLLLFLFGHDQRAQAAELELLKKHYETTDEEQIKLLDKPEQCDFTSVFALTSCFALSPKIQILIYAFIW